MADAESGHLQQLRRLREICPYSAPSFIEKGQFAGKAEINPVLCKGCGLCVASCRSGALNLKGFDKDQIFAQIFNLSEAV